MQWAYRMYFIEIEGINVMAKFRAWISMKDTQMALAKLLALGLVMFDKNLDISTLTDQIGGMLMLITVMFGLTNTGQAGIKKAVK